MNGAILWRGPSRLDGSPVVVVATGLDAASRNGKTGDMVQVWILVDGQHPAMAVRSGADAGICGDCRHRGTGNGDRTCYVSLATGLGAVGRVLGRGDYPTITLAKAAELVAGRQVRIGTYGDPAAVPMAVWDRLLRRAAGWTSYTHQWRRFPALRRMAMASVDTPEEREAAKAKGWRTFRIRRVTSELEPVLSGEIVCPASAEGGHRVSCADCGLCKGTALRAKDIVILPHDNIGRAKLRRLNVIQGVSSL